jgi:molecular chaperone GrpE
VTNGQSNGTGAAPAARPEPEDAGPVVRDNRVVDPETGDVRRPDSAAESATPPGGTGAPAATAGEPGAEPAPEPEPATSAPTVPDPEVAAALALADERLVDLQRLHAEYVNYRKRVERDRAVDYARGVADVVDALIPVLDDLHAARQHGELGGPFAAIAEKLEVVLEQRFGVERYGAAGEEFNPAVHEALMHATSNAVEEASVSQVLQPGYRVGERVLRAARVAVIGPE